MTASAPGRATPSPAPAAERQVVGFGGGCHWCTEAVFQALRGVERVEQGWIRSAPPHGAWSEAVRVTFRPRAIGLRTLVEVHLLTHASTAAHAMRTKYRSAVYTTSPGQQTEADRILDALAREADAPYVTQALPLVGFRLNDARLLDYYRTRPEAPFCTAYIDPKLAELRRRFAAHVAPAGG